MRSTSADRELGIGEVAVRLNVSETYVVELLDHGNLPHVGAGSGRRIKTSDVDAYQRRDSAERRRLLDELTKEAQALGLGYR